MGHFFWHNPVCWKSSVSDKENGIVFFFFPGLGYYTIQTTTHEIIFGHTAHEESPTTDIVTDSVQRVFPLIAPHHQ